MDGFGYRLWTSHGIRVADMDYPAFDIIPDGEGGAILSFVNYPPSTLSGENIYAQRVDASGVVQWTSNGVAICTASEHQRSPAMIPDGDGGAIIVWTDPRNGYLDIYAQKVNDSGVVQWTTNGVEICTEPGYQESPRLTPDGVGGAIIIWIDNRETTSYKAYVQRINQSGIVQWAINGIALCDSAGDQVGSPISDGSGGAIIAWSEYRSGVSKFYAQRIDSTGTLQWASCGIPICTFPSSKGDLRIVSDHSGGAILCWRDRRAGSDDLYAQRVNHSGVLQWTTDGVVVRASPNQERYPDMISDESGGAIVTWQVGGNIYAQKIDSSGVTQWPSAAVAISTALFDQLGPTLTTDGRGGAVITWDDYRYVLPQIYAQQVDAYGNLGMVTDVQDPSSPSGQNLFQLGQNYPNPFNAGTTIEYLVPKLSHVMLKLYDVLGRQIATLVDEKRQVGSYSVSWNSADTPSGVYFYRLQVGSFIATKKLLLLR
ncbi:MAG: T9SS type A sorting domain-containing protein [Bacteroidota bacterium]